MEFKELTLHENLTLSYSESVSSITPIEPLKPHFYTILKFVYFLVINNTKYLVHVVDNIIFGISVPDYPSRTVESRAETNVRNVTNEPFSKQTNIRLFVRFDEQTLTPHLSKLIGKSQCMLPVTVNKSNIVSI